MAVAEALKGKVAEKLQTDIKSKSFYEIDCGLYPACDVVMVHAEQRGRAIIVKFRLRMLPSPSGQHPEESSPQRCLVEEGTGEKDCLDAAIEGLGSELIEHNKRYHRRNP